MITKSSAEFFAALPPSCPILGLDFGTKTIGTALSDRLWMIASPDIVIKRKKFTTDAAAVFDLIQKTEAAGIVLGWPLNMDGTEGPRAQSTRAFALNLQKANANCPPILLFDERLSTVEAERAMIEADLTRHKRKQRIDALAAQFILQWALDHRRGQV